jgi:hypothetical protein
LHGITMKKKLSVLGYTYRCTDVLELCAETN